LDESRHSHRVEQSKLKLSLLQSQSEIEQEKDNLLAEVESGRMKIHALEQAIDEMTARVAEKVSLFHLTVYSISLVAENQQEKDITCRVQAAVDDEVHHCTELVQEKLQLEAHIAELERYGCIRLPGYLKDRLFIWLSGQQLNNRQHISLM
jgi:hypothetical protein